MKRMSFSMTSPAIIDRTKTVTRRPVSTWRTLKVGDLLAAVDKSMGLKKGERSTVLAVVRVVSVRVEPLTVITVEDCVREGLPSAVTSEQFIARYAAAYDMDQQKASKAMVRRIEFEYLQGDALIAAHGEMDARAKGSRKARERKAVLTSQQSSEPLMREVDEYWSIPR